MGAWNAPDASHVYSPRDVQAVVTYARARGIRTVAEFDTPGHSSSWGLSQPGLLTQCYSNASGTPVPVPGEFGPIDPTQPANWAFLTALFTEITSVFPDSYIHIGGDEVSYTCWESNPLVVAWMAANNVSSFEQLESYYVQRIINIVDALGKSVVAWQEVFDNGLELPPATVVTAWKGGAAAGPEEMARITKGGFRALLSAGWYENYIAYGAQWPSYYSLDPAKRVLLNFPAQRSRVQTRTNFPNSSHALPRPLPQLLALHRQHVAGYGRRARVLVSAAACTHARARARARAQGRAHATPLPSKPLPPPPHAHAGASSWTRPISFRASSRTAAPLPSGSGRPPP
jgi:hypothetical protein